MTVQQEQALRNSLDEMDRKRRRSTVRQIAALILVVSDAVAMALWRPSDMRLSLALGLAGVILVVALGIVKLERVCYDNTRRILRAIELLSESKVE